MLVLELLGTLSLRSDTRPVPVAAHQKRPLGLLAILALGGRQGLPRDRVEAYLWPESAGALARHSLDQTVYALRRALGSDVLLSTGRELRLNPDLVEVDVWEFDEAVRERQWAAVANRYKGTLLDGIHFADSRELESLLDTERARLLEDYRSAVEHLADDAAEADDHAQCVTWSKKLANSDPLSARATKRLMFALAAVGDRAGAVKHARLYQELVRQDLEMEPDSEIEQLACTFSRAANSDAVTAAPPRTPPMFVSPAPNSAIALSEAPDKGDGGGGEPVLPPTAHRLPSAFLARSRTRFRRSRMAAVLTVAALLVLIGAVTIGNKQRRDQRSRLGDDLARRNSAAPPTQARDAYIRALDAWSDGSKQGLDSAVVYFRRATELDGNYAEAYAGLADAYVMLAYFGYAPSDEMMPRAKVAALRSMKLDGTLASAHPALAYELSWERDFPGADAEFKKAIALEPTRSAAQADPTYASAHEWYSILLMILSQKPDTSVATQPAAAPDPFSLHVPVVEIEFTKWIDAYPTMAGFTSYGPGTMSGAVLSRIDDGTFTHMVARYEITDPEGTRSWKAVVQGKASDETGSYDLRGIVTWGWMIGAQVHASFQRTTPCKFGKRNICFRGTIRLQRGQS